MRLTFRITATLALLLLLAGCRSPARHSASTPQVDPAYAQHLISTHLSPNTNLTSSTFSAVDTTNRISAEWLRSPTNLFKLGPGDVIDVEILRNPTSKATISVGPDGKIYYSLLPGLLVWGLTLSEAKDALEKNLAKYFRDAQEVALSLRAVGSKRVWILGSVSRPGIYPLATPLTLVEAISGAGGTLMSQPIGLTLQTPEDVTDLANSFVMREGKFVPVNLHALFRKGDLSQNIYLQPDDFIYLRSHRSSGVYVLGAVALPNVVSFADTMSVAAAIASVGGTIKYAHKAQVAVVRGSLAEPKIAIVDYGAILKGQALDMKLERGDIVYVPFSPFRKVGQIAEVILNQFVSAIALNEGTRAVARNTGPIGVSVGVGVAR